MKSNKPYGQTYLDVFYGFFFLQKPVPKLKVPLLPTYQCFMNTWSDKVGLEEREWPALSPDLTLLRSFERNCNTDCASQLLTQHQDVLPNISCCGMS